MSKEQQKTEGREEALAAIRQKLSQALDSAHKGDEPMASVPAPRPDPADDWHAYQMWYQGLSREGKMEEWRKYNEQQPEKSKVDHLKLESQASNWQATEKTTNDAVVSDPARVQTEFDSISLEPNPQDVLALKQSKRVDSELIRRRAAGAKLLVKDRAKRHNHTLRSLLFAGSVFLFLVGLVNNQLIIAQAKSFVSPGSNVGQSSIIITEDNSVGPENKIIIPKIGVEVPVVFDQRSLEEEDIQASLKDGVVRYNYPGTVLPGQIGNSVILGHSSGNFFSSGKYKFAFVLLNRLEPGDTFIVHYDSQRYVYRMMEPGVVVPPSDFGEVAERFDKPVMTLITCDPPGTNLNRYIIQAEQISPSPAGAEVPAIVEDDPVDTPTTVPSNSPGFWESLFN